MVILSTVLDRKIIDLFSVLLICWFFAMIGSLVDHII